jgi:pimeloyl-ACP methyl ester carboxylesterase
MAMKCLQAAGFALATIASAGACGDSKPQVPGVRPAAVAETSEGAPAVDPIKPTDYANNAAWLCRPGSDAACRQNATTTTIYADGRVAKEGFVPNPNPPIDCFYVYPTISRDATANSDITAGPEEKEIVRQQLERFGLACRLFAPIYRQVTVSSLRRMFAGAPTASNREMAYVDVKAAWERYLKEDNDGRGVVLIGHSQGAGLLTRLIAAEIDGKPVRDRMVSALLIGATVEVPQSAAMGGTFRQIPLCATADSVYCVIAYSSFRAAAPPPADSLFGVASTQGMRAACVNPAELDGSGGQLEAMLPASAAAFDDLAPPAPWTAANRPVETPFVSLPGMLSAKCVVQGGFSYLAVTLAVDPADARTDQISGDVVWDGAVRPQWGLHVIDMHLAMGNLVEIVKRQGAQWIRARPAEGTLPPEFHNEN